MNKMLITGGAGFVGSHLTEYLSKKIRLLLLIIYLMETKYII